MKPVLLTILFTISNSVYSSQEILGEYTTVSESECNSEIHFLKDGKGVFKDSCRKEDGPLIVDIHTENISWRINNDVLVTKINGIDEVFKYHEKLPCVSFGESGDSNGLIGFDMYFWRKPVECK